MVACFVCPWLGSWPSPKCCDLGSWEKSGWALGGALTTHSSCLVGMALGGWDARVSVTRINLCMAALAVFLYMTSSSGNFSDTLILRKSLLAWSAEEVWEGVTCLGFKSRYFPRAGKSDYHLQSEISSMNWANNLINILSVSFIKVFSDLVCWSAVACDSTVKSVVAVSTLTSGSWKPRGGMKGVSVAMRISKLLGALFLLSAGVSSERQEQQDFEVPRLL